MCFDKVKAIIADILSCDEEKVTLKASLKEDLGMDSLDAMEVSLQLEDAFDLKVEEEALQNFLTVEDIVNYLENHAA